MNFKAMLEKFLYITISLFLIMLMIVFGFSAVLMLSNAMVNFTVNENPFMGLLQMLIFTPILGGLTGLVRNIRKQYFSFKLFDEI